MYLFFRSLPLLPLCLLSLTPCPPLPLSLGCKTLFQPKTTKILSLKSRPSLCSEASPLVLVRPPLLVLCLSTDGLFFLVFAGRALLDLLTTPSLYSRSHTSNRQREQHPGLDQLWGSRTASQMSESLRGRKAYRGRRPHSQCHLCVSKSFSSATLYGKTGRVFSLLARISLTKP